jgi:hypothetical protein
VVPIITIWLSMSVTTAMRARDSTMISRSGRAGSGVRPALAACSMLRAIVSGSGRRNISTSAAARL